MTMPRQPLRPLARNEQWYRGARVRTTRKFASRAEQRRHDANSKLRAARGRP